MGAYLFLHTERASAEVVARFLSGQRCILGVDTVVGAYDLIASVDTRTETETWELVGSLRALPGVVSVIASLVETHTPVWKEITKRPMTMAH
jgi:hypothetical protein